LIFSLTPGPTVMLISAYGFKGGFRDAMAAIAGTQTGNTLWYVICVTGLGALVTASPLLFHVIKLAGAAYLAWLGLCALWKSRHAQPEAMGPRLKGKPYWQATLTQIGNPKAILFFGAIVPQFLDTYAPLLTQYVIMFAVTFVGESIILTGYGALAADIDAHACAAIRLNAQANGCDIAVTQEDVIGTAGDWDVILVGDLFYERPLAERLLAWLGPLDVPALLGDPGRNYFPKERTEKLASYSVQTTRDLEDREIRETGVYRLTR
ncbi:MAG TPA: LysE family transporter, partial [Rhizomicrobium sp.]